MAGYPPSRDPMYNTNNMPTIPADYDLALHHQREQQQRQQQQQQHHHPRPPNYDFQADLDMFTNTQFFDLDMGEVPDTNSPNSHDGEVWGINGQYIGDRQQVANFNSYGPGAGASGNFHPSFQATPNASMRSTPSHGDSTRTKSDSTELKTPSAPQTLEEASRMAAEEDKRRRNTAASARFRVKKKQREQALEKTAKDMTDRVTYLENRVQTLEMENKLLKDLITEKQGQAGVDIETLKQKVADEAERTARGDGVREDGRDDRRKEVKIESAELRRS